MHIIEWALPWGCGATSCRVRCAPTPVLIRARSLKGSHLPDSSDVERLERFFDSEDEDFEILSL